MVHQNISIILSSIAIIVSIISLLKSWKTQKINEKLMLKQLEDIERKELESLKAIIDVDLQDFGDSYKIVISNNGGSEAKNIHFNVEGKGEELFSPLEYANKFPVDVLKPNKQIWLAAHKTLSSKHNFFARVYWDNPDGKQEKAKFTLSW